MVEAAAGGFCRGRSYSIQPGRELGQLYTRVVELLEEDGWQNHKVAKPSTHVILAGAQASKLDYRKLGVGGVQPLVNYYRGFEKLTQKVPMVRTLRHYAAETGLDLDSFLPRSFLFCPGKEELCEYDALEAAHEARVAAGERGCWILKSSNGAKGEGIVVMQELNNVMAFLRERPAGASAWVAQEYLERPLLLPGGRKFDIRSWVLLGHDYRIYLFSDSVVRACSVPWDLDDLSNRYVHLSNHCVQEQCEDYGKHESPINLINFPRFAKMFDSGVLEVRGNEGTKPVVPPASFEQHVLPQIKDMIRQTLLALQDEIQVPEGSRYGSMQAFGYDFMIDADFNVRLLEVNATPALSVDLLEEFAQDLKIVGIERYVAARLGDAERVDAINRAHMETNLERNQLVQIYP